MYLLLLIFSFSIKYFGIGSPLPPPNYYNFDHLLPKFHSFDGSPSIDAKLKSTSVYLLPACFIINGLLDPDWFIESSNFSLNLLGEWVVVV